jgi:hypothetical protein
MRARDRADDVEGVVHVGHPVAHRLVQRVLERLRTRLDRHDRRAEELHAVDVLRLALHVLGPHVHDALEPEARRHGRGRDPVLPRAGLGDHPRLPHAPREQRLAERVVHLVRAGVVQVLALEVDLGAAEEARPALRVVDGARATDVVLELVLELGDELGVLAVALVGRAQLFQRVHERLGDEHAAVGPEMPPRIGKVIHFHRESLPVSASEKPWYEQGEPVGKGRVPTLPHSLVNPP